TVCEIRIQTFTAGRLGTSTQVPLRMNAYLRSWPLALAVALVALPALAQPLPSPPPPMQDDTRARPPPVRAPLPPSLPADARTVDVPAQPPLPVPTPGVLERSARGAEARGTDVAPSRWQSDLNQLDAD